MKRKVRSQDAPVEGGDQQPASLRNTLETREPAETELEDTEAHQGMATERLLIRLRAVGRVLAGRLVEKGRGRGIACLKEHVAQGRTASLAVDAMVSAMSRAHKGEVDALAELAAMSATAPSRYREVEMLCERWRDARPTGAEFYDLTERLARLGVRLPESRFYLEANAARSARNMTVRLIVAANAIDPRRTGESAEKHKERIKQALKDAWKKERSRWIRHGPKR